jgi:hypothetical protein
MPDEALTEIFLQNARVREDYSCVLGDTPAPFDILRALQNGASQSFKHFAR